MFRRPSPIRCAAAALLSLLLAVPAAAQDQRLAEILDPLVHRLGPHAVSSVRVLSLSRGEALYARNADLSMNPASNQKLVTSAAALAKLGPEYRFTTRVLVAGKRGAEGVLTGDLVLQGGGDPVLETAHLEKLADAVKAAGIRRVTGRLLADDTRYDERRLGYGWNWDDEPYYYSAQISALGVNRNVFTVDVLPGKTVGAPAVVRVRPLPDYVRVTNRAKTVARGGQTEIDVSRARGRNEVIVEGTIPLGGEVRDEEVTMEAPELFAATLFRNLLADRGVRVAGVTARGAAPESAGVVTSYQSIPLSEIVRLLNKPSDNLIAEMLLKELGHRREKPGSARNGAAVVTDWLKEIGIDTGGVIVADGSGLSRQNLLTARAVSDLLLKSDAQPWREAFIQSLPVAGVDGTLRRRLKETPAEGNVKAKTGSLSHVTALGGYVTTAAGERLAFSILVNNYPGRVSAPGAAKSVEDAIAAALAGYERQVAGR